MRGKNIVLQFCCVGILIFFTTCTKRKWVTSMSYEGALYDTIGGHPVQGVTIYLKACYPTSRVQCNFFFVGQSITDAFGHFKIKERAARSDRYSIEISEGKLSNIPIMGSGGLSEYELKNKHSIIYLNVRK